MNFTPRDGPTSGGTVITINAQNLESEFTSATADLVVRIGKSAPTVMSWNHTHVICVTVPVDVEIVRNIRIHIKPKDSLPFFGKAPEPIQSYRKFSILKPVLLGFKPTIALGSSERDVQIGVKGENLNIGNNRTISLWSGKCFIHTNDGMHAICKLTDYQDPRHLSELDRNVVHMSIDGWSGSMTGKVDEAFMKLFDEPTTATAGTPPSKTFLILSIVFLTMIPVAIAIVYLIRKVIRKKEESVVQTNIALKVNHLTRPKFLDDESPKFTNPIRSQVSSEESISLMPRVESVIDEADVASFADSHKVIALEHLMRQRVIGEGHFGKVYKGQLYVSKTDEKIDVAIKTIGGDGLMDRQSLQAFVKEALIMKDFDHPNVMSLIGISFATQGMVYVVMPFMAKGDLYSYLRKKEITIELVELVRIGLDVAKGMAYLEAHRIVHRDLAARNCLLDDEMNVRVSDFGLSRDVYQRGYYQSGAKDAALPIRSMAPEAIEFQEFTSKSDVWSFGVLLWELFTRGALPYPAVSNSEVRSVLNSGQRLEQPKFCPNPLYQLMMRCWTHDPETRPTFEVVVKEMSKAWELETREYDKVASGDERLSLTTETTTRSEYENLPSMTTQLLK